MTEQTLFAEGQGGPAALESAPVALKIESVRCGRALWLQLHGVLNWHTAEQFRHEVDVALKGASYRRVIVDLTDTEYVGGNGLRALLDLHGTLSESEIELRLVVPKGSRCARSVALAGLANTIPTFPDFSHAWHHGQRRANGDSGGEDEIPVGNDAPAVAQD